MGSGEVLTSDNRPIYILHIGMPAQVVAYGYRGGVCKGDGGVRPQKLTLLERQLQLNPSGTGRRDVETVGGRLADTEP